MKRARPIPSDDDLMKECTGPRKIRVIELEDTSDEESYSIIKYNNL